MVAGKAPARDLFEVNSMLSDRSVLDSFGRVEDERSQLSKLVETGLSDTLRAEQPKI